MADRRAVWVYAVIGTRGESGCEPATGVAGVAGGEVRLVGAGDLAVAVSDLPPEAAGEAALQQRLQQPQWLEQAVRRHHEVVSGLFAQAPTVPCRLATVYQGDDRIHQLLAERAPALRAAIDTVTGRAEWGVRAYPAPVLGPADNAPPEPAPPDPAPPDRAPAASATPGRPGTAYLLRRHRERAGEQQARAAAAGQAQRLASALRQLAVAAHELPDGGRTVPGEPAPVSNWSYLIDNERADWFVATARRLRDESPRLRLRLTGPWPAYSFVAAGAEP